MAGEEILGHGKIVVEVDSNVGRELKEVEAQFDRTMAKLDRKEAELRLGADTSEFYAKLRKAQADKERWEHERATATLDVDARKANAGFANATRRLKQYEAENVKLYNRVQQLDEDRALAVERNEKKIAQVRAAQAKKTADAIKKAEQEAVKAAEEAAKKRAAAGEKARAAEIKAEEDKVRAAVAAEKKRALEAEKAERKRVAEAEKAARAEAAAREKAEKAEAAEREKAARAEIAQREKTVKAIRDAEVKAQRAAEQASARRARESEKARRAEVKAEEARVRAAVRASRISEKATSDAEALRARELSTVKRDTVRYLDLLERRQKLVDKRNRVFIDKRQRDKIDLKIDAHTEEIDRLEERLHRLGHPPPKISFDVDERGTKALSRWAAALSDTTVRLGPFTSTIGGAIRALTLLGPVVVGVAGAVLSLGGAIGAGLAGGIGLGSAALAGFVPLIGGTAVALLPVAQNLKAAFAAQKKYNDAVSKYGSKSKQAKTAQDQLNSVFAHMPKQTAEAFKGLERLKKSFQDATKPAANRDFGKVFSEGIKTADKLLPSFAARTRGFMNRAADGISEALQRLRSKGGRDTLNNLFDNANRSLTPLLHGLTSLGAAFGHIASDFSNFLPGLSKGFADWADNVNRASKSVSAKNAVHTMVDGFKALIHITASATRLLATFFGVAAGRGGGIDFLNSIADGMDRISDNIRANPGGLGSFFKDSIKTTQDLYQVLKPLAQVFIEWATIMRPFSDIILNVSATFGRLISDMARFKGVRDLLVGAFGLFLAGTLVSKVLSVVDAVKELGAAIKALGALKVGGAAIDFLSGGAAGNVLGRFRKGKTAVAVGEDAVKAAGGISTVEKAAGAATVGLAAFEGAEVAAGGAAAALGTAGAVAATGGVALLAAGAIYGSYKLLTMKSSSDKLRDSLKHINAQTTDFVARIRASADVVYAAGEAERNYHASLGRVAALKKKLNDLEEHGKKNTAEYRAALERLNTELGQRQKYETEANKFSAAANKFAVDATAHALRGATARGKLNDALKEQAKWQKIVDETGTPEAKQRLRDATNDVAAAQKVYNRELSAENLAQRQAAVNVLNYQRALHGLVELSGDAATSLSKLALKSKSLATKIALKFVDPKDAGAVAGRASAALKSGVKSTIVTHIVADSKSAEEAIRKLGAQVAALRARRAAVSIGLDDRPQRRSPTSSARSTRSLMAGPRSRLSITQQQRSPGSSAGFFTSRTSRRT
jgi:chemotaxis protein histidine kinase CheA